MRIEIENLKGFSGGWSGEGKRCNYCKTAAAAAFCRSDSTFLCLNCDTKIHEVNKLSSRHERVWMCEVCEQAPAAVTCKADAAALCVTCDADIHAANPLARRHERVPVEPFYDSAESIVNSSSPINFLVPIETDLIGSACPQEDTEGTSSWLLPNQNQPSKLGLENHDVKPAADLFFSEMYPDPYLDFEYPNSVDVRFRQRHHSAVTDSLVPVQTKPAPILVMNNKNCLDIDMCKSKISPFNYAAHTLSQSVSSSSMDAGVVPDGNSMSEISYSFSGTLTNGVDPSVWVSAGANQTAQLCGIDREARVLRYREKRKNRKFEKTIRYASRKAYAETRPRIKGRFAKRTEVDKEVAMDRFYGSQASAAFMADTQYGIVPSF